VFFNSLLTMQITFIIVSYNTRELTRAALRSVYEQTRDAAFTVQVVDNASTDGSAEMIAAEFPQARLLRSSVNLGFGPAVNRALREIRAGYVFLLNSDAVLLNNAAKIFHDFMEQPGHGKVAACGGGLYYEDMTPQPSFGNFPSAACVLFEQALLNRLFKNYYRTKLATGVREHPAALQAVDYLSGAALFLRRSALDEAGLFDEDFFLYFEETELSFRLRLHGYAFYFIPEARIVHARRQSTAADQPLETWARYKQSEFMFYRKCYGAARLALIKSIYLLSFMVRLLVKQDRKYWQYAAIVLRESGKRLKYN
jgi:GT2 family glycosyltransferase